MQRLSSSVRRRESDFGSLNTCSPQAVGWSSPPATAMLSTVGTLTAPLEDKAGLVTGAAGGIGRAVAVAAARAGASVVIADLESQRAKGEETVRLVQENGGEARFVD